MYSLTPISCACCSAASRRCSSLWSCSRTCWDRPGFNALNRARVHPTRERRDWFFRKNSNDLAQALADGAGLAFGLAVGPRGPAQVGPFQEGLSKVDLAQVGLAQVGPAQDGVTQVGPAQVGPAQVGPAQVGLAQVGPAQVGLYQVGLYQVGVYQLGPAQVGPAQVGPGQVGPVQVGFYQDGLAQEGPAQVGPFQVGLAQVGRTQDGPAQVGVAQRMDGGIKNYKKDLAEMIDALSSSKAHDQIVDTFNDYFKNLEGIVQKELIEDINGMVELLRGVIEDIAETQKSLKTLDKLAKQLKG